LHHNKKLKYIKLEEKNACGTVACILGYAPEVFKVKKNHFPVHSFSYWSFSQEYFGINPKDDAFDFLFGVDYGYFNLSTKENIEQFEKRIAIAEQGIPKNWTYQKY